MFNYIRSTATPNRGSRALRPLLCSMLLCSIGVTWTASHAQQTPLDARNPEIRALIDIYHLDPAGNETPQSLRGIDWLPASDSALLTSSTPDNQDWFPLLPLTEEGEPLTSRTSIAIGTETSQGTRRAALGANLIHDLARPYVSGGQADARSEAWLEHMIAWLVDRDMPFAAMGAPKLNVVLAHLAAPDGTDEDAITRDWFEERGDHIKVSSAWSCDGEKLVACAQEADLVVLGPGQHQPLYSGLSTETFQRETQGVITALAQMDSLGIPVLYVHDGATESQLAEAVLSTLSIDTKANTRSLKATHAGAAQLRHVTPVLAAASP